MRKLFLYPFYILFSFSALSQSVIELNNLAYEQIEIGHLDSGLVCVNMAIKVDSTFFGSYYNRGVINRELGKTELAIEDFTTSIMYNPNDISSYMNRGIIYSEAESYNPALGDFSKVVRLDSTYKEAYFNIGLIYLNKKELNTAEMAFNKCIELDSKYHAAIFRLGKTYLFSQKYDDAFKSFNQCIMLYDKDPEYFELRGIMNFMKGLKDAGCEDLKRAAELGELSPPAIEIQNTECK